MIGEKEKRQKKATYSHLYQSEFTPAVRQMRHPNANGADSRAFVHNSGVNGATQPCLIVKDLKLGDVAGPVALWLGPGTEAWFADLKVNPEP